MKRSDKILSCTLAGLALCTAANAVTSESSGSRYLGIAERNVFGLKPPPELPKPEDNRPPPPKILYQGLSTFGGVKRALFKAQMPAKPGEPPKGEQSFILAEGQRDGDMEVLEIDANAPGSVKVSAFGTIITLDFEHNGIKTTTGVPAPGPAPRPGMGFQPPGSPGANPGMPASRRPGVAGGGMSMPAYNPTPVQPQVVQSAQADTMSAEQKFLMEEAYRAKMQQTGQDQHMPPLPPTPLTQELNPPTPAQ